MGVKSTSAISLSSMLSEGAQNEEQYSNRKYEEFCRKEMQASRTSRGGTGVSLQVKVVDTWTLVKGIVILGTLSFILTTWFSCVYYMSDDGILLAEAFYRDIPRLLYSLPVAAFGCAMFLNLLSWVFETHRTRQQLCILVTYISSVAFLYEVLALYGRAPILMTQNGRPHSVMRYIMWSHTTPAMVYALSMLSEFDLKRILIAITADVVMILAAVPGEYCSWWVLRYGFNSLSLALFPFVMHEIWTMFTQAMDVSLDCDRQAYRSLRALRGSTMVLWSIFPLVWTLCQLDLIDSVFEEALHSIADVFGKIVFSSSLLQSNFVSIEARRRLASKAAEDANRSAVIFELQELLAQKEEFITVVTHELRTPLNGIIGLSEALLATSTLEGSHARNLGAIRNSGMRLLALVNDVLDAAAMKRGTLSIRARKVQISKLIDDVIELTAALLSPGVKLVTKVSAMTPPIIGDPQRLVQVLYNLVGNACKFTEEGEIVIEASGTADDEFVVVTVQDTGTGIPQEKLDDIFIPFSRGNMSACRRHGGTGLGLSVVKHIVEAHGGEISVKSEENKGSCFTFTIPCARSSGRSSIESYGSDRSSEMWKRFSMDSEARKSFEFEKNLLKKAGQQIEPEDALSVFANSKAPFPDDTEIHELDKRENIDEKAMPSDKIIRDLGDTKMYKILSVDDDPVNQMVVQAMLKNRGFDVITSADGERALDLLDDLHGSGSLPDAVLLDVMMPGLSGFDVVRQIRSRYPDWGGPVLLVSASGQKEQIQEGLEAGANAYLTKPLKINELANVVKHYITEGDDTPSE
jgi:signal transduction histidine kinase/CheY-like chemotaxis protein